ncbi:MAG TPA: hypothetical protein PKD86_15090 [Gemmatales bacterium]|nr:hypothetical protein [Gemmatales bacterium]HMP60668.1 hypothetical protein [Gemmatales bacterium]
MFVHTFASTLIVSLALLTAGQHAVDQPAEVAVLGQPGQTFTLQGKLFVLGTSPLRLRSPALPPGQPFTYDVVITRGPDVLAQFKLPVRAGISVTLDLHPWGEVPPSKSSTPKYPQRNFGIITDQLALPGAVGTQVTLNGQPVAREQARALVEGRPTLPHHQGRPRLTIIGSAKDREAVLAALRGPLAEWAADFIIKDYEPSDWAVAGVGFRTDGRPTIYAQEPDGQVLFRLDSAEHLAARLRALRVRRPDYDPERDPTGPPGVSVENGPLLLASLLACLLLVVAGCLRVAPRS